MESNTIIIILITILVFLLLGLVLLFQKIIQKKEEANELRKKNHELNSANSFLQAESLKFQLQPHALNNVLANLKVMTNKLNRGMDSLSETLEYIVYKGNNHFVTVEDEIIFIKKYLFLNDLFISEIDSIKIDTSQANTSSKYYKIECLPHLVTAYFLENAFKHGDVNHPEFLHITIKLSDTSFEINVTNSIKNNKVEKNKGLGLNNMKKRLDILIKDKYQIKQSCNEFRYYSTLIINF